MNALDFSIDDLVEAYRKAKVDAFYDKEVNLAIDFARYELKLLDNLERLRKRIAARDWPRDESVWGGYDFIPKDVDYETSRLLSTNAPATIMADPWEAWKAYCEAFNQQKSGDLYPMPEAHFRIIGRGSVDWQVISALWIIQVGHHYDAALGDEVRGSRLRRLRGDGDGPGDFNGEALGCFEPYAHSYISWREDGLQAIRVELEAGHEVVAITADIQRFYHEVSPEFMLDESFNDLCGIPRSARRHPLTHDLIASLQAWASQAPNVGNEKKRGVPIGLSASRVIANCALIAFDRFVSRTAPVYYGRYVDDIFLVLRNAGRWHDAQGVWAMLVERSGGILSRPPGESGAFDYRPPYDPNSELRFTGRKQRAFFLQGDSGKVLLREIDRQVRINSSEWRHLPERDGNEEELRLDFVAATRQTTESPDNLRKSDGITIRRLQFALHLRDLEAYSEDLEPHQWKADRQRFFQSTCAHVFALPHFFMFATYVPRLLALAVASHDWDNAKRVVEQTRRAFSVIEDTCYIRIQHHRGAERTMAKKLRIAVAKALPRGGQMAAIAARRLGAVLDEIQLLARDDGDTIDAAAALRQAQLLYRTDLAREPYRWTLLEGRQPPKLHRIGPDSPLASGDHYGQLERFWKEVFTWEGGRVPMALAFPTRPFSPPEVSFLARELIEKPQQLFEKMRGWMRAVRGIRFFRHTAEWEEKLKQWGCERDHKHGPSLWVPEAPSDPENGKVRICMPCLEVSDESWTASASGAPDPDRDRYSRTAALINDVLRCPRNVRPHYVILPELALKSRWFWRFAHKLSSSRISLISGIEYQPLPKKEVINQVRASLVTQAPGYWTYLVYKQNKEAPALVEMQELRRVSGVKMVPGIHSKKWVIRHGDFQFGILICSELMNIRLRARFRGKIDALIIPQWNRDTESFVPLVEGSALDLHAFVVQSNNRQYGDCRIRAPYKDSWKRDEVRIKGGMNDYFAIGQVDFYELRRFQSNAESPPGPFKPVPDGFSIDPSRRMTPRSSSD